MKNNEEILGMPIVAIKEGVKCGIVSEMIIDTAQKAVRYFILDTGRSFFGLRTIAIDKLEGIGEHIVTAASEQDVLPLWEDDSAMSLAYCGNDLIGASVMTSDGNEIGSIKSFSFDSDNGRILGCELNDGHTKLHASSIISISKEMVFVSIPENMRQRTEPTNSQATVAEAEPIQAQSKGKENLEEIAKKFEARQTEHLIGKVLTADIIDNEKALGRAGQTVDRLLIDKVKRAGLMMELSVKVK